MLLIAGLGCLILAVLRTVSFLRHRRSGKKRKKLKPDGITAALYVGGVLLLALYGVALLPSDSLPDTTTAPTETDPPTLQDTTEPSSDPTTVPTDAATEPTVPPVGWAEDEGGRFYLLDGGHRAVGWLDLEGKRYYFNEEGYTLSGWQEVEGLTRYFRADGSMARGQEEIDGVSRFFTSTGAEVMLVNPWNPVPADHKMVLVELSAAYATADNWIDEIMLDALTRMMDACNAQSGSGCCVLSGYRSVADQEWIFENKVSILMGQGLSEAEARREAATVIAIPGTSEHQLGLAVDIIDTQLWELEEEQEDLEAQRWLMEHCWEYGFILRYPKDQTAITGIIYEPWHYRYVGLELAEELHSLGWTLEEYLDTLD